MSNILNTWVYQITNFISSTSTTTSSSGGVSLNKEWPSYIYEFGILIWVGAILCTVVGVWWILAEKVFKSPKKRKEDQGRDGQIAGAIVLIIFGWLVILLITVVSAACSSINDTANSWYYQWISLLSMSWQGA